MGILKILIGMIFAGVVIASYGNVTSAPIETVIIVPSLVTISLIIIHSPKSTVTPTQTATPTATPDPDTPLGCNIVREDGKLYVLHNDVFFAFGPSGEELDQALMDNDPDWADYE